MSTHAFLSKKASQLIILFLSTLAVSQSNSEDMVQENNRIKEIEERKSEYEKLKPKIFSHRVERSPQIVIGHFKRKYIDFDNLKKGSPVELSFVIEKRIKWDGPIVKTITTPIPYPLYKLREKTGRDEFHKMGLEHAIFNNKQKIAFSKGNITEDQWLNHKSKWEKEFKAYRYEMMFVNKISGGFNPSFEPEIKYAIFFRNRFDSQYTDWNYVLVDRTFSIGEKSWAEPIFDEIE